MQEQNKEVLAIVQWLRQQTEHGADLKLDSRDIQAGDVFVASKGQQNDGAQYIQAAIENGAVAVLLDADSEKIVDANIPILSVSNLRSLLGELADEWYGKPSETVKVIAITGTNGKTSCASGRISNSKFIIGNLINNNKMFLVPIDNKGQRDIACQISNRNKCALGFHANCFGRIPQTKQRSPFAVSITFCTEIG